MEKKILICEKCKREVEVDKDYTKTTTCKECGGMFYEKEDDSDEELFEDEEEYEYECEECREGKNEEDIIDFQNVGQICKSCIEENYPREKIIIEKPVFIDKKNKEERKSEEKSKFD